MIHDPPKVGQTTPTRELDRYAERLLASLIDARREGRHAEARRLADEIDATAQLNDLFRGVAQ